MPLYRSALATGLTGLRRRRATIQLASSLRNLGAADEAVSLLSAELAAPVDGEAAALTDAVRAFLALALVDVGQPREAASLALGALAAHLPRYQRRSARTRRHCCREPGPVVKLVADCGRCVGLCCVAPGFVASADFAFSKPAGVACRHRRRLALRDPRPAAAVGPRRVRGVRLLRRRAAGGRPRRRRPAVGPDHICHYRSYDLVRQLHEPWYATAPRASRPAAAPVHPALAAAVGAIDGVIEAGPATLEVDGPATHRGVVAPLLRRASALVRATLTAAPPRAPTPHHPTTAPGHPQPATTPAADGDRPTTAPAPVRRAAGAGPGQCGSDAGGG